MILELMHIKRNVERLSLRKRTDIDDEFLESLPQDTKLYQAYFMGKTEGTTKEIVTTDLLSVAQAMNDTEGTYLLKISRQIVEEGNA